MSFLAELKRRNVFRVSAAYVVGAWAIAQVGDIVFDNFDAPPWAMRTLLVLLLVGLPIAAIAAWAFELGPEGLRRDEGDQRSQADQARVRRRLNQAFAALLAVGLCLAAVTFLGQTKLSAPESVDEPANQALAVESIPGRLSIAVLPFVDMSPNQDQQHLADGVATELMTALHRVDQLRVASRTSAFAFRNSGRSIGEIAAALRVDHIVEGSVRRYQDNVRVEAALVDVRTDKRLWSASYSQELRDAFALQAGITRKIAAALKVAVGDETSTEIDTIFEATANPEAYEEFLIGTTLWARRGEENIRNAIKHLMRAIELEPNFARAEAALANAYITLPSYALIESTEAWDLLTHEVFTNATEHAQNALALDPLLVDPYSALADIARMRGHWSEAERLYQKGIGIDPSDATINLWYAEHLQDLGYLDRVAIQNDLALRLDPMSPGANVNTAGGYLTLGDCESLDAPARKGAALGHEFGITSRILCQMLKGNWAEALTIHRSAVVGEMTPFEAAFDGILDGYAQAKDESARVPVRAEFRELSANWGSDPAVILMLASFDMTDDIVNRVLSEETYWGGISKAFWGPPMLRLRKHPRFNELLEVSGLLDYYRESGTLPDECVWAGDTVDCAQEG